MKEEICKAFCDEIRVKDVPVGLAISTALRRSDGDAIGFYVVKNPLAAGYAHLEDDGTTVAYLEAAGVDFATGTRSRAFNTILDEYGAQFDESEAVIRTADVPEGDLARASIGFAALLLRLDDFLLLTEDRVKSAFKDDAKKRIHEAIGSCAIILEDEIVGPELAEVRPDLIIKAEGRDPVAVFLASSAQRINDAIFLQMAALYESTFPLSVIAMIETDSAITAKLRQRACNRLTAVPVFRNDESQAVNRVVREAIGPRVSLH